MLHGPLLLVQKCLAGPARAGMHPEPSGSIPLGQSPPPAPWLSRKQTVRVKRRKTGSSEGRCSSSSVTWESDVSRFPWVPVRVSYVLPGGQSQTKNYPLKRSCLFQSIRATCLSVNSPHVATQAPRTAAKSWPAKGSEQPGQGPVPMAACSWAEASVGPWLLRLPSLVACAWGPPIQGG